MELLSCDCEYSYTVKLGIPLPHAHCFQMCLPNEYCFKLTLQSGSVLDIAIPSVSTVMVDIFNAEISSVAGPFEHFEYEDEDGDRIAVRTDEDLQLMLDSISDGTPTDLFLVGPSTSTADFPTILPDDLRHLSVISNGAFGTVYKSLLLSADTVVAVKCIQLRDDRDSHDDILAELRVMGKCCRSDFVVHLIGAALSGNTLSIITEYMDAGAVTGYIPLPPPILLPVCRCIAEGVAFLATLNIMHRVFWCKSADVAIDCVPRILGLLYLDLKPENFVANSSGYVKLADFGASKVMERSIADSFVGTNAYMAPERIYGEEYRIESEVWSMGMCFLEMATGRFPLEKEGENLKNCAPTIVINRILHEPIVIPELVVATFGPDYANMVERCLVRDVQSRIKLPDLMTSPYMSAAIPIDRTLLAQFFHSKENDL